MNKRWKRSIVLACTGCIVAGLMVLPSTAAAKGRTGTYNRCVSTATNIPDGPADGASTPNPAGFFATFVRIPKFKGKPQSGVVTAFNSVGVRIAHTDVSDLALFLVSPGGRAVALSTYRDQSSDKSGDGFGTGPASCGGSLALFGDAFPTSIVTPQNKGAGAPIAGSFSPEQSLSTFVGGPARGYWTLIVQDVQAGDPGQIDALSLNFNYRYKAKKKRR
jgi:subtilisin-like proprotein convertase family protein